MIVSFYFEGKKINSFISDQNDLIQRNHVKGSFYELEELEILRSHFLGGVFVDIGANIGNHSMFASIILRAKQIVCFEANEKAIETLKKNIELNNLAEYIDQRYLGFVVSSRSDLNYAITWREGNLGGAKPRLVDGEGVKSITGDESLIDRHVDYIKIDVEGGEMQVLEGLKKTISRCRPRIFIEVDNKNETLFAQWLRDQHYQVDGEFRRYKANNNFFISPKLEKC